MYDWTVDELEVGYVAPDDFGPLFFRRDRIKRVVSSFDLDYEIASTLDVAVETASSKPPADRVFADVLSNRRAPLMS